MNNPSLQNRLENALGEIRFPYNTPLTPPYGRLVYDHTDKPWVPIASNNKQSNCKGGRRIQSRLDSLDLTLALSAVSLLLNLETKEISLDGTKLLCNVEKGCCHPTALTKATIVWEPELHGHFFEMLRFNAYMVKYQDRYWIETNTDWTLVWKLNKQNKNNTKNKNNTQIATRFEVYGKPEFYCGSTKPLYPTEYEDTIIIYEHSFDMNTGKPYDKNINIFYNQKFVKLGKKRCFTRK